MKRTRHASTERKMKPVILVFCEGETEETYINFLKGRYRIPIQIIPKVTGQKLTQKLIDSHIRQERINRKDSIHSFLMYGQDETL